MKWNKEQIEKAKIAAKDEVQKERFEEVKEKLVELYEREARAVTALDNIRKEVIDYEMELEEK